MILQPVLMRIAERELPRGPRRLEQQRRCAHEALRKCAELCAAPTDGWRQSEQRVPLPNGSFHWSISHKRLWVAAVVADRPAGIDIEHVAPRRTDLFDEVATEDEWSLVGRRDWSTFFRIWTAKEATLKANGLGIGYLAECKVVQAVGPLRMTTSCAGRHWVIEHFEFDEHIAALACFDEKIRWHIVGDDGTVLVSAPVVPHSEQTGRQPVPGINENQIRVRE